MYHFFKNILACASKNMLYKFERFIVVKVAERVQILSREKCNACVNGLILDQLHNCMQVTLKEKIKMFLPRAKADALTRLDRLFSLYQQSSWVEDERAHLEAGENCIEFLTPDDLLDRRFINEDTVLEYPFNPSWLSDELSPVVSDMLGVSSSTLPPILPLDLSDTNQRATPKKPPRKRTKTQHVQQSE